MNVRGVMLACLGAAVLAAPASAQIIATSIPREDVGGGTGAGEGRWALHLMVSPFSKWRYNELIGGVVTFDDRLFIDSGVFTGTPNSDFLLAGEAAFQLGENWSAGVGGWYNKVGKVGYDFEVESVIVAPESVTFDSLRGTLDGDLTVLEGHANLFYKSLGIQAGLVRTRSRIDNSRISASVVPGNIGRQLGSVEGDENNVTDWDLYGVYKWGGGDTRPWGLSVGAGIYHKKGGDESGQRLSDSQIVPSGFVTASIALFKGFGVDASYWYVGKTEASSGEGAIVTSDAASRFTIGLGYTFSN